MDNRSSISSSMLNLVANLGMMVYGSMSFDWDSMVESWFNCRILIQLLTGNATWKALVTCDTWLAFVESHYLCQAWLWFWQWWYVVLFLIGLIIDDRNLIQVSNDMAYIDDFMILAIGYHQWMRFDCENRV